VIISKYGEKDVHVMYRRIAITEIMYKFGYTFLEVIDNYKVIFLYSNYVNNVKIKER